MPERACDHKGQEVSDAALFSKKGRCSFGLAVQAIVHIKKSLMRIIEA
ncbi:hypothetical protein [Komagataeibacter xylinus]|nr:hypothetical protein [Komagataeibacter xylinus]